MLGCIAEIGCPTDGKCCPGWQDQLGRAVLTLKGPRKVSRSVWHAPCRHYQYCNCQFLGGRFSLARKRSKLIVAAGLGPRPEPALLLRSYAMAERVWLLIGVAIVAMGALLAIAGWSSADGDIYAALGLAISAIGVVLLAAVKFS